MGKRNMGLREVNRRVEAIKEEKEFVESELVAIGQELFDQR